MLLWLSIATAETNLETLAQGLFLRVPSEQEVIALREKALQETLSSSNVVVRTVASAVLEDKPYICLTYDFRTVKETMTVTCDSRPIIDVKLDGTPTVYPTKDGTTHQSVAKINGNEITQTLTGDNGQLDVIYVFSPHEVSVTKRISTPHLGTPLEVTVAYRQSEEQKSE